MSAYTPLTGNGTFTLEGLPEGMSITTKDRLLQEIMDKRLGERRWRIQHDAYEEEETLIVDRKGRLPIRLKFRGRAGLGDAITQAEDALKPKPIRPRASERRQLSRGHGRFSR